jgi:hypothetical protein
MGSKKPLLVLSGVVGVSILAAILLSRVERTIPPPEQAETELVPIQPAPTPAPTHDPEDFSTTRRLSKLAYKAYYDAMVEKASTYTTVQMRTFLSLPEFIEGQVVEAEVRLDAIRPDRWAKQIFASRPENKSDPHSVWEVRPRSGTLATPHLLREIEHDVRTAFEINLDATDEFLQSYFTKKRSDMEEQFVTVYRPLDKIP